MLSDLYPQPCYRLRAISGRAALKLITIGVTFAALWFGVPAMAQVTNDGLLGQAMGREQQRMQEQPNWYTPNTQLVLEQDRERKLEHCLSLAINGSPVPQKCIALIPKSEQPLTLGTPQATVTTIPIAPPPTGPRRVRAKTPSGYCLDAPVGYVGTGAENSPPVTTAMPRCDQLSAR
jgi:hypothetical protein